MSFREKAEQTEELGPGVPCGVAVLMETLEGDDLNWFVEVIADENRKHIWISRVLRANDVDVSANIIGRHRRKDCRCVA